MEEEAPQRQYSLRDVFDALRWMCRGGSPWRYLPGDFPPWRAVYQQRLGTTSPDFGSAAFHGLCYTAARQSSKLLNRKYLTVVPARLTIYQDLPHALQLTDSCIYHVGYFTTDPGGVPFFKLN